MTTAIDVLILEDSKERVQYFKRYCSGAVITDSAERCMDLIAGSEHINELWLDHDLGGEKLADSSREDCGMEVVRYLKNNQFQDKIDKIFIHSLNGYANIIMFEDLRNSKYNVTLYAFSLLRANLDHLPPRTA